MTNIRAHNRFITSYITFISGAKPIAENRHNMKRTKIKHTTHIFIRLLFIVICF